VLHGKHVTRSWAKDNQDEESNATSIVRLVLIVMNQHSIILRAAKPTFDEGLVFARYLDQAAEGFFRFMLGRRVADIIATAYIQPNNDFSHQNVTFAECDEVIVGMASGYTAEQHRRSSGQPLKLAAGYRALRMVRVAIFCAPFRRFLDTLADDDFYLQAIAVDKELRGEGVGSTLIDCIEGRARAIGSTRLSLDVSAKNEGARRLYERRGMTVESGWPSLLFIPRLFVRMTKLL
jgi:ribosomal protein S18 acetylase RimI-like enzyme